MGSSLMGADSDVPVALDDRVVGSSSPQATMDHTTMRGGQNLWGPMPLRRSVLAVGSRAAPGHLVAEPPHLDDSVGDRAGGLCGQVDRLFAVCSFDTGERAEERRVGKECVSTGQSRWSASK